MKAPYKKHILIEDLKDGTLYKFNFIVSCDEELSLVHNIIVSTRLNLQKQLENANNNEDFKKKLIDKDNNAEGYCISENLLQNYTEI